MVGIKRFKRPEDWGFLEYLGLVLGATRVVSKNNVVTEDLEDHCKRDELAIIRVKNDTGEVLWRCPRGNLKRFVTRLEQAGLKTPQEYMVLYPYRVLPSGPK
ncbi:hypothetical protein E3J85_01935 [Patescibacteria group bacterium]|nr:MAG: hypothetical protein E3J85_01935 [Patescibacteria group bacterium]